MYVPDMLTIYWGCFWHTALGMLPVKSTAATYTQRTIRKKSCSNNLLYNSRKHFLNTFWNFVFCLKFHLQQFPPPNENFKNSPFPHLFLPPPPPLISLSSKIQSPLLHKWGGAATMIYDEIWKNMIILLIWNYFKGTVMQTIQEQT